ncbi:hypothetical protein MRX96_009751 [Rhipicephalus microplus]
MRRWTESVNGQGPPVTRARSPAGSVAFWQPAGHARWTRGPKESDDARPGGEDQGSRGTRWLPAFSTCWPAISGTTEVVGRVCEESAERHGTSGASFRQDPRRVQAIAGRLRCMRSQGTAPQRQHHHQRQHADLPCRRPTSVRLSVNTCLDHAAG